MAKISSSSGLSGIIVLGMATVVIVAVIGSIAFFRNVQIGKPASTMRAVQDTVDRSLFQQLEEENKSLQKQIIEIKKSKVTEAHVSTTKEKEEKEKLDKKVKQLTDYKKKREESIQSISKRQLLRRYGPSPHYVEVELSFDPASNLADASKPAGEDTEVFMIQLAPVDEMPATVFHFLEQVNETLFDGASFHRNAGHVVQGGPAPNFESTGKANLNKRLKETGLFQVPFQE